MTIEIFLLLVLTQTVLSAVVSILSLIRFRSRSLVIRLIGFIFLASCIANVVSYLFTRFPLTRGFVNTTYPIYLTISLPLYSIIYYHVLHRKNSVWFKVATG